MIHTVSDLPFGRVQHMDPLEEHCYAFIYDYEEKLEHHELLKQLLHKHFNINSFAVLRNQENS